MDGTQLHSGNQGIEATTVQEPLQLFVGLVHQGNMTSTPEDDALTAHLSAALDRLTAREHRSASMVAHGSNVTAPHHVHRFGFALEAEGSRDLRQRVGVCGALEHDLGKAMDPRRNVLFIIGTQKGGTTYLFNALTKHPAFVGAEHAFAQPRGPWAKEVHFFNRFPLPRRPKRGYLQCFPASTWSIDSHAHPNNFTLVDATPDYLFNAMAPPRIKALWPRAKFVVLLRDPIARAYSAWMMSKRMSCRQQTSGAPPRPCHFHPFAQMVVNEAQVLTDWGCTFGSEGVLVQKTWAGCYGCRTSFVDSESCPETGLKPDPCNAPPHLALSVSTYAAQLAWWFAHFPRARFKFITSKELHVQDPTPILNDILAFSGIDAAPFQAEMLRNVWEHNGGYDVTNLSSLDHKAIKFLQLYFQQANADLDALLGPDFGGIPPETLLE